MVLESPCFCELAQLHSFLAMHFITTTVYIIKECKFCWLKEGMGIHQSGDHHEIFPEL